VSRAFVKEDAEDDRPPGDYGLPSPDDPSFDAAAALVLLEAARDGETAQAEAATGDRWGDPHLAEHVRRLLEKEEERPEAERDERFLRMARRYLSAAGE
jgi:hypothetical protein